MQLEPADVLRCSRVRRPLQKRGEPLATVNVTPLRRRTQLASVHILNHALAQRSDRNRTHRQLPSWMRLTTPRSSRQDATDAIDDRQYGYRTPGRLPAQRVIAQRFRPYVPFPVKATR